ncbi:hypothetical protein MG293_012645 [Ovis ammon polii]|uniref:Uncharacterized protein n=1 Tax=Ovis ammon polii TaxID=230172 RepID=A0AAD4U0Y5_OVIAM|nr:hypothetical protein MG293_012645 [Ovis ammon polii]
MKQYSQSVWMCAQRIEELRRLNYVDSISRRSRDTPPVPQTRHVLVGEAEGRGLRISHPGMKGPDSYRPTPVSISSDPALTSDQGSKLCLLQGQVDSLPLRPPEKLYFDVKLLGCSGTVEFVSAGRVTQVPRRQKPGVLSILFGSRFFHFQETLIGNYEMKTCPAPLQMMPFGPCSGFWAIPPSSLLEGA